MPSQFVLEVTRNNFVEVGRNLRPSVAGVWAIRCKLTEEAKEALGGVIQKNIVFVDTPSFHTGYNDTATEKEMTSWLSKSK